MAVIGAIILNDSVTMPHIVRKNVTQQWFSITETKAVFAVAMTMFSEGKLIDLLTLGVAVDQSLSLFLHDCVDECVSASNAEYYIKNLESCWMKDQAVKIQKNAAHSIKKADTESIGKVIESVARQWEDLILHEDESTHDLGEIAESILADWESDDVSDKISWPLNALNHHIGPIEDDYMMLAAAESAGKTAFVLDWLIHLNQTVIPASLWSGESNLRRLVPRLLTRISGVNTRNYKLGRMTVANAKERIHSAKDELKNMNLSIHHFGATIDQLKAWGMQQKARGSKILILDNMRHIRTTAGGMKENERYARLSLDVKHMRDDIGIPIVLLHHLNQEGEIGWATQDIKKDVDILAVMSKAEEFCVQASKENHWVERCVVKFDIRKNRDGDANMKPPMAEFNKQKMRFFDYDASEYEPTLAPRDNPRGEKKAEKDLDF